ncbi:hypothetical protein [Castellaniella sp. GW247-6E4]|uniref:hypothetical protein n=1 Tax=Castellaniella sp. GW247-6E4 TaxID=3140380 RepID=UPI0033163377
MEQTWALGATAESPREIEIVTDSGVRRVIPIEQATQWGVPKPAKVGRYVYEGDFASWRVEPPEAYLAGLGFAKISSESRHQVFTFDVSPTLTAHVPALALMRAFFKPHYCVLPAIFRPASLDMLSFVDYGQDPPTVVLDHVPGQARYLGPHRNIHWERAILWCQLSLSARKMAWSVYRNALEGTLGMNLSVGQTRVVLHGVRRGGDIFVTRAALSQVIVPAEDSLTGAQERYLFHAGVDLGRKEVASVKGLTIPVRPDGRYEVSDVEWEQLEPGFFAEDPRGRQSGRHSCRRILDLVLFKISSGTPWNRVTTDRKLLSAAKFAFRRWTVDGRLGVALELLTAARSCHATAVA